MAQKFLSDIDFAEDPPRPLPVWRVSPSEIRDSIKPHPPDRGKKPSKGSWSTVNRCQRDKLAEKTSEKAPETQPDDPVCETRIRYPTPPLSPSLLLSFLSSPPSPPLLPGSTIAPRFSSRVEGRVHLLPIQLRTYMWPMCPVFYDHHRLCFRSLTKRDETWYVVAKVWGEKREPRR